MALGGEHSLSIPEADIEFLSNKSNTRQSVSRGYPKHREMGRKNEVQPSFF